VPFLDPELGVFDCADDEAVNKIFEFMDFMKIVENSYISLPTPGAS
jgi:hypothetical protein